MRLGKFLCAAAVMALLGVVFCGGALAYSGGSGTESNPYRIASLADLEELRDNVNSGKEPKGKYYRLEADISIGSAYQSVDWIPIGDEDDAGIGYAEVPFSGHFDGNGRTISINIDNSPKGKLATKGSGFIWARRAAIFAAVSTSDSFAIKNLHVIGKIKGDLVAGIAAELYSGEIRNCTFSGTIESDGEAGGIVSDMRDGVIADCHVLGGSVISSPSLGGIVNIMDEGTIQNCSFSGTANGKDVGGIAYGVYGGRVTHCRVTAGSKIVGDTKYGDAGGIVADLSSAAVSDCEFAGMVTALYGYAGGIVASSSETSITNCRVTSTAEITGDGGIVGYASGDGVISDCNVEAGAKILNDRASYVGGVAGETSFTIRNCTFSGTIQGMADNIGGIVGSMSNASVQNCTFNGAIHAKSGYVGGIAADIKSTKILGCHVSADAKLSTASDDVVGGIVGEADNYSSIQDCTFSGAVEALRGYAGGIAGGVLSSDIINCKVLPGAVITGYSEAGGIVDIVRPGSSVKNCTFNGSVKVTDVTYWGVSVGGIAAWMSHKNSKIVGCKTAVSATISAVSAAYESYAGGIVGYSDYGEVSDCSSSATISNAQYIGGIAGAAREENISSNCTWSKASRKIGYVIDGDNNPTPSASPSASPRPSAEPNPSPSFTPSDYTEIWLPIPPTSDKGTVTVNGNGGQIYFDLPSGFKDYTYKGTVSLDLKYSDASSTVMLTIYIPTSYGRFPMEISGLTAFIKNNSTDKYVGFDIDVIADNTVQFKVQPVGQYFSKADIIIAQKSNVNPSPAPSIIPRPSATPRPTKAPESGSSGGGGCSDGFGAMALMLLTVFAMRRKG